MPQDANIIGIQMNKVPHVVIVVLHGYEEKVSKLVYLNPEAGSQGYQNVEANQSELQCTIQLLYRVLV